MAVKLGSLLIELGLDSAKFRSGTRSAQREMTTFQRGVTGSANLVKGAIVGMVASIGIGTFTAAIRQGLEYASSLGEVAQQLGVTTKSLQEYRYAASQVGLTTDEMDAALARLTRTVGTAPEKLERLGIAVRDANGNIRDAGELLPDLAQALQRLESPAERAAVLVDIFGRSGQKLAPLLADGAAGVNNLRDAAHRLGLVLTDEQIRQADEAADAWSELSQVLSTQIAAVVGQNAESLTELATAVRDVTIAFVQGLAAIGNWIGQARRANAQQQELTRSIRERQPIVAQQDVPLFGSVRIRRGSVGDARQYNAARRDARLGSLYTMPTASRNRQRNFNDDLSDQALNGAPSVAVGLREVTAAATAARPALAAATPELQNLLDTLFPVTAARRELADNIRMLDAALQANQITLQQHAAAVATLRQQFGTAGEGPLDFGGLLEEVEINVPSTERAFEGLADHFEDQAERMARASERTQDAFYAVLDGLRGLSQGIKSGDIFSILEGVIGILNGIGSGRAGGLNIGGLNFGGIPGFATGTNFAPGGLAWVGERGRELVNLPRGSQVVPNNKLAGLGGQTIVVNNSALADVYVDGRIATRAPGIASAGATGAMRASQRIGQRRLA